MTKQSEIWTIGSILKWTEQYFNDKGVESSRLDAEVLLSRVLGKERIYLYVHFDQPLQQMELGRFREMIKQRVKRIPVAYILGEKEFMGMDFSVSPAVLIPRPDTEILVENVIERLKKLGNVHIADIGTGSGAIAVSILASCLNVSGVAVDISSEALAVAKSNAIRHGVDMRLEFVKSDVYDSLSAGQFDAIISNPPYGERLLDDKAVDILYNEMGQTFAPLKTWSKFILTSDEQFESKYGMKADKKRKLYNGTLRVDLYQYFGERVRRSEARKVN